MVSSVSSSSSSTSTPKSSSANSLSASYEMFLQLLTTQLQTQSPLDPVKSTEFTQQLATYAGLEQQIATNSKLDSVLSQFDSLSMSTGVGYIGRVVEADSNTVTMGADGTIDASWQYKVGSGATSVKLTIADSSGNTVWTGTGDATSGTHAFKWDGKNAKGKAVAAGDYTLKVTATDADGKSVDTTTTIKGTVTAVDSSGTTTMLELGDTKVKLGSITRLAA